MTTEMWLIALYRVLGSLPVLRWPFFGAILALLVDNFDLLLMNVLDLGGVDDYQEFDKSLDQVYMLTFLIVALRWAPVPRNIAVALYSFRMAGFLVFELTQERDLLILFPNVFEFWFIFVAGLQFFGLEEAPSDIHAPNAGTSLAARLPGGSFRYTYSPKQIAVALAILLIGKLAQEYILHVGRWFDDFTMLEALEAIWQFLTPPY